MSPSTFASGCFPRQGGTVRLQNHAPGFRGLDRRQQGRQSHRRAGRPELMEELFERVHRAIQHKTEVTSTRAPVATKMPPCPTRSILLVSPAPTNDRGPAPHRPNPLVTTRRRQIEHRSLMPAFYPRWRGGGKGSTFIERLCQPSVSRPFFAG